MNKHVFESYPPKSLKTFSLLSSSTGVQTRQETLLAGLPLIAHRVGGFASSFSCGTKSETASDSGVSMKVTYPGTYRPSTSKDLCSPLEYRLLDTLDTSQAGRPFKQEGRNFVQDLRVPEVASAPRLPVLLLSLT